MEVAPIYCAEQVTSSKSYQKELVDSYFEMFVHVLHQGYPELQPQSYLYSITIVIKSHVSSRKAKLHVLMGFVCLNNNLAQ